jgi:hypothetical protein
MVLHAVVVDGFGSVLARNGQKTTFVVRMIIKARRQPTQWSVQKEALTPGPSPRLLGMLLRDLWAVWLDVMDALMFVGGRGELLVGRDGVGRGIGRGWAMAGLLGCHRRMG